MTRSAPQQRASARAGNAAKSVRMRALFAARAAERELVKLATAAGCSLEEAAEHRRAGRRFCQKHGWYQTNHCAECRRDKRKAARAQRVQS